MGDEISVTVASYGDGRNLMMTYRSPTTGKKVAKSSGTTDRGEAIKAAGKWEDELRTGRYQAPSRLTWAEFRQRYEAEKLASLSAATQVSTASALNHLERVVNPDRLVKLTSATMSRFQSELRKQGLRDTTVAHYLRHIRAALSWGVSMGMLAKVPNMHSPKRPKGQALMRGRPITAEEFDRLLAAVPKVRPHDAPAWIRLLRALWLSGLRLSEALVLSWDSDAPFAVDLSGRRPALRIFAEAQKARRDEVLPMTPDFAHFLAETPEAERHDRVFTVSRTCDGHPMSVGKVGEILSAIGKKAGVVVNKTDGKFASAHDLRRAFGTRWARRVMPAVLKRLMRHSSIATTMGYYVDLDAAEVADQLWAGWGDSTGNKPEIDNTLGNTRPQEAHADGKRN